MIEVVAAVVYHPQRHEFLLMKRSSDREVFPGRWEFPSGMIEEEESARKAVRRELKEETGLNGDIIKTGEPHLQETDYGDFRVHPFLVLVEDESVDATAEHQDYAWFPLGEIQGLETVKGLEQDLVSVGVSDG